MCPSSYRFEKRTNLRVAQQKLSVPAPLQAIRALLMSLNGRYRPDISLVLHLPQTRLHPPPPQQQARQQPLRQLKLRQTPLRRLSILRHSNLTPILILNLLHIHMQRTFHLTLARQARQRRQVKSLLLKARQA